MRTRMTCAIRQMCRVAGTSLVAIGSILLLMECWGRYAYHRLGSTYGPAAASELSDGSTSPADGASPDWQGLRAINPDVCGWIQVEGTDIDLPVLSSASVQEGYYLTHDLWQLPSRTGVPFLDSRCGPEGRHCLVYGHHLATGGQFSALQRSHRQAEFDALGRCLWRTPDGGIKPYEPLCALVVDQDFEAIQHFVFEQDDELRAWLARIVAQAEALSPEAQALCARATRVMTLVTCASDLAGQPWRTLVLFAS